MTIQLKAIEQYFHVVLSIILYKVILTLKSMFVYKVGVAFKSVSETLVCDHSHNSLIQAV